jgi:ADP-ribose pyrophosphatase YjhB (NUDIX family)
MDGGMGDSTCFGINAVVLDERGRLLLARRDRPPIWNLPGGSWEQGEAPWDTAVREVREEVAADVEVVRLTGVYDRAPDGEPVLVFLCRYTGGAVRPTAEAVEVGWFAVDELPPDINPYQPERFRDALGGDPGVFLRRQPGPSVRALFPD